jgi:GNAT superfamily N-acetyltransferase
VPRPPCPVVGQASRAPASGKRQDCIVSEAGAVGYAWRGDFHDGEIGELRRQAFEPQSDERGMSWRTLVEAHSLGWVVARSGENLVGFVNVVWDGWCHAWLQDLVVATEVRRQGVGTGLVVTARDATREAGCEWLHVDFDSRLRPFYLGSCGFAPTSAGLIHLR